MQTICDWCTLHVYKVTLTTIHILKPTFTTIHYLPKVTATSHYTNISISIKNTNITYLFHFEIRVEYVAFTFSVTTSKGLPGLSTLLLIKKVKRAFSSLWNNMIYVVLSISYVPYFYKFATLLSWLLNSFILIDPVTI